MTKKEKRGEQGFTIIELSVALLLVGAVVGFCALGFQKTYALYQLNYYARQLLNDIRFIQQQSIIYTDDDDPDDLYDTVDPKYIIKFFNKDNGNKYEVGRKIRDAYYSPIRYETLKEMKLPRNIELTFPTSEPFSPDDNPLIRVLEFFEGECPLSKTGKVKLKQKMTGKEIYVIVNLVRARISNADETS